MVSEQSDVFEDVLNLEEQYYQEGFDLGVADGSKSGRIEGRTFGLEKGFEKFREMGVLNGKAAVWKARLPLSSDGQADQRPPSKLPSLGGSDRMKKHVDRLSALTDPDGLSTENSEDAVSDFDDQLKDAKAKATLIARITGEDEAAARNGDSSADSNGQQSVFRVRRNDFSGGQRRTGEMEDFLGLPTRSRSSVE